MQDTNTDENTINTINTINSTLENKILTQVENDLQNNGWNERLEQICMNIGKSAYELKNNHEKLSRKYTFFSKLLHIILMLLSTGIAAATFNSTDNVVFLTFKRIINYTITFLTVLLNFLSLEKLATQHSIASSNFSILYHDIQQQFCLSRTARLPGTKYTSKILKTYDNLLLTGPFVNHKIEGVLSQLDITIANDTGLDNKRNGVIYNKPKPILIDKDKSRLEQIHNCNVNNDIFSDRDLENIPLEQVTQIRSKVAQAKVKFELDRNRYHHLDL
jgi:hypothetical protein